MEMGLGRCVGTAIGFLGWLIGLAVACVATGETAVLGQVALPGLAVSLGAAGVVLVTLDLATRANAHGGIVRLLLWGQILFFVGLLILLLNHWIAPLVDTTLELRRAMDRLGGVYRTGDAVPAALMAGGTVLLGLALARLRRPAA